MSAYTLKQLELDFFPILIRINDHYYDLFDLGPGSEVINLELKFEQINFEFKETKSATMNIFRKKIFSFQIICKSRIKLSFHNKPVHYS